MGQLGDGTLEGKLVPVVVSSLGSGIQAISAGDFHACAVTTAGATLCWGSNAFGGLGDGTTVDYSTTPVLVTGLGSGVASVSAGTWQSCALTTAGNVFCWGYNAYGQVGDGTQVDRPLAVPVPSFGTDTDGDGVIDLIDLDDDGDGVPDYIDAAPLNAAIHAEKVFNKNAVYHGAIIRETQSR